MWASALIRARKLPLPAMPQATHVTLINQSASARALAVHERALASLPSAPTSGVVHARFRRGMHTPPPPLTNRVDRRPPPAVGGPRALPPRQAAGVPRHPHVAVQLQVHLQRGDRAALQGARVCVGGVGRQAPAAWRGAAGSACVPTPAGSTACTARAPPDLPPSGPVAFTRQDDLVCLPPKLSSALGGLGPLVLVTRVTNAITLTDPTNLRGTTVDVSRIGRGGHTCSAAPQAP